MNTVKAGQVRAEKHAGDEDAEDYSRGTVGRLQCDIPLWHQFLSAHRMLIDQLAEQMMNDHQLPLEWFDVLIHLAEAPGMRLRQRALRDQLLLSESGVSRLLVRMARTGLITRCTADEDRRGVEVALTEKGSRALAAATTSHQELVDTLFTARLTATDRTALQRVLSKLLMPE